MELYREYNDRPIANAPVEPIDITYCPKQAFQCSIPSLTNLCINGNVFATIDETYSAFYLYFPILKTIKLLNIRILPENIFVDLSKMESLQDIFLRCRNTYLTNVTDVMFTQRCKSQWTIKVVPAIAGFKKLRILHIASFPNLTDKCVVDGIALSSTLRIASLQGIRPPLTTASQVALHKAGCRGNSFYFKRKKLPKD